MEQITIDRRFLVGISLGGLMGFAIIGLTMLIFIVIGKPEFAPLATIIVSGLVCFWAIRQVANSTKR